MKVFIFLLICVLCAKAEGVAKKERAITTKVGLAWGGWDAYNMYALAGGGSWSKVSWAYTWSPWSTTAATQIGLDFVPMLWGPNAVQDFTNALNAGVFDQSTAVLAFNEPERSDQANMSVDEAIGLWWQYMEPVRISKGLSLGAPVVSSAPEGKVWLQQFFLECSTCNIDFIPLHYYGSDPQGFIDYVTDIHNTFGKNIWVTEWNCNYADNCNTEQGVLDFMAATTSWMVQQDWIERFSWFGATPETTITPSTDALLTSDGTVATYLGYQYTQGGYFS